MPRYGRDQFPEDRPRAGDITPSYPQPEIARIVEVDQENYVIKVAIPMTRSGVIQNAIILKRSPGEYELPRVNDFGLFIYDGKRNPICVGYLEIDYPTKVQNFQAPRVRAGQKYNFSRGQGEDGNPENMFMVSQSEGEYKIADTLGNGMTVSEGETQHTNDTEILDTAGGDLRMGNVKRATGFGQPEETVNGPTGILKEFLIRLYDKVTTIKKADIRVGDVVDDYGIPEPGPLGALLRLVFRIFNALGIEVASITVDDTGNMLLVSKTQAVLKSSRVALGSESAIQPYLLTIPWIQYFITHTHMSSAPGTPTSPVMVLPNPNKVLSKKVFGE